MLNDELKTLIDKYGIDRVKSSLESFLEDDMENEFKKEWNFNCRRYGFEKDDLGKMFYISNEGYEIIGLKTRNRKYPILAKNSKGTIFKFDHVLVKAQLIKSA